MTPDHLTLGIDEAGRGPLLGPLVVAAVALDRRAARRLSRAGVADSKAFGAGDAARRTRATLVARITREAAFVGVELVDVADVDSFVAVGQLNQAERDAALRLCARAPICARTIADGRSVFGPLATMLPDLRAWDRAESRSVAVAAASLVAKCRRDEMVALLEARYAEALGPVRGGGYVNEATRRFVRAYARRHRGLPPELRLSWPRVVRGRLPHLRTDGR